MKVHVCTYTHANSHAHVHTPPPPPPLTYISRDTHTHTHKGAHAYTHTHVHTLTTEKSPPRGPFPFSLPLYSCRRSPQRNGFSAKLDQYWQASLSGDEDNVELHRLGIFKTADGRTASQRMVQFFFLNVQIKQKIKEISTVLHACWRFSILFFKLQLVCFCILLSHCVLCG